MAVSPADPTKIYYIPRSQDGRTFGGLYVYNITTNTSTEVSSASNTPTSARLSIDPDGLVWAVIGNGTASSFNPATGSWTDRGVVVLPNDPSTNTPYLWSNLGSGDLTFDGHGAMYLVASDTKGVLFTIIKSELFSGSPQAVLVGDLGNARYNCIAFTEDGNLWGSSYSSTTGISTIYKIDIAIGNASFPIIVPGKAITDLGSCALSKAVLSGGKTSSPAGTLNPGDEVTYNIEVCNNGSLASTATIFKDAIPSGTTYVPNSTTQNGLPVADVGGSMPYITEKKIFSTGQNEGSIGIGKCVTIEFKVNVDGNFAGTEICNSGVLDFTYNDGAFATDDPSKPGGDDATCNTVINPIIAINKTAPVTNKDRCITH